MLPGAVVPVFLGQTEVDKKELVAVASDPHQEVIRLDIPAKKRGSNFADFVPLKIYLYLTPVMVLCTRCSSQSELFVFNKRHQHSVGQ